MTALTTMDKLLFWLGTGSLAHYLVIAIGNPPPDTLRSRRIDCEVLEGLAFCESPWSSLGAGITPGALCCRSGFPPIPAETARKYSKRSLLTVLFRSQFQTIRLMGLSYRWLICGEKP